MRAPGRLGKASGTRHVTTNARFCSFGHLFTREVRLFGNSVVPETPSLTAPASFAYKDGRLSTLHTSNANVLPGQLIRLFNRSVHYRVWCFCFFFATKEEGVVYILAKK